MANSTLKIPNYIETDCFMLVVYWYTRRRVGNGGWPAVKAGNHIYQRKSNWTPTRRETCATHMAATATAPAAALRALLSSARSERRCIVMPACHDALSAALIARAGFEVAFMSGYAVSATSLALPDAGLISYGEQACVHGVCMACAWRVHGMCLACAWLTYGEQVQVARNVCEATRACGGTGGGLLVIGDGDTGFGGSGNVRRTVRGHAA